MHYPHSLQGHGPAPGVSGGQGRPAQAVLPAPGSADGLWPSQPGAHLGQPGRAGDQPQEETGARVRQPHHPQVQGGGCTLYIILCTCLCRYMDWYIKQQHEQHEQLRQRQLDLQHQQEAARQRIKMKQRQEAPVAKASQVRRNSDM